MDIQTLFSALANDTRLRCMMLLQQHEELCVCELIYALGLSQPLISRHLAHLREAGLVQDRRAGLWIYYRLHGDLPEWALEILQATSNASDVFTTDVEALRDMPNRPGASCCA